MSSYIFNVVKEGEGDKTQLTCQISMISTESTRQLLILSIAPIIVKFNYRRKRESSIKRDLIDPRRYFSISNWNRYQTKELVKLKFWERAESLKRVI